MEKRRIISSQEQYGTQDVARRPCGIPLQPGPFAVHSTAAAVRDPPRGEAMSNATPAQPSADRNLLYGILALQMDFVSRDALIAAMSAWVLAKHRPLGELLQEQGDLTASQRQALDLVVGEHLKAHGDDPRRSLAAVGVPSTVHRELESVADGELRAGLTVAGGTLATTGPRPAADVSGTRYSVLRPHARGGLGTVSVARDTELGREVALKEIQVGYADDTVSQRRFVREAEITGGLEHPGVVPVYGLGRYGDGRPYYAMRFIRGESLQDALRKLHKGETGYTLRGLLTRFVAVCNAIAYAHSRGVIHRDLKPANVMLGPYGETLVVDWGLAKVVGHSTDPGDGSPVEGTLHVTAGDGAATRAGTMLGTPAFMSPEQAAGRLQEQGPATDVYGLGATLYAVLTGRGPIEGRDTAEILENVRQGNWEPPRQVAPSVSPALDAVCCKALALRPEDRYPSALALAADVERWLADEPVGVWREPLSARAWRRARRYRTLVVGAVVALLVGTVSLGIYSLLLAAANGRERAATRVAEQQRDRANQNLKRAREAIDHFHTEVSQSAEMKARGVEKLRTRLLEGAVDFYERLAQEEEEGGGDEIEAERGRTRRRLASMLADVGKPAEAEARHREAIAIARRLADAHPGERAYRGDLAAALNALGMLYAERGQGAQAEAAWVEEIGLRRELAAGRSEDADCQSDLAMSLHDLATLYSESGQFGKAEKPRAECIEVCRQLDAGHPEKPEYQWPRANSLHTLALWYGRTRSPDKAEAASKEAGDLFRRMITAKPHTPRYQRALANCLWARGFQYSLTRRPAEAASAYAEAVTTFRRLVRDHPAVTDYQSDLAGSLVDLADFHGYSNRPNDALATYDEAIRLLQNLLEAEPRLAGACLFLSRARTGQAETLGRLGRSTESSAEWSRAAESWERSGELARGPARAWHLSQNIKALVRAARVADAARAADTYARQATDKVALYNAACLLSQVSTAAAKNAVLPPFTEIPLSQQLATRAVEYLRRALAAGYNDPFMKKDPDLDPLRGRADFQQLFAAPGTKPM
jgi:tetratricopeptide (TPR) repeat protein